MEARRRDGIKVRKSKREDGNKKEKEGEGIKIGRKQGRKREKRKESALTLTVSEKQR